MKRTVIALLSIMMVMNGCNKTDESGYIGQSDITVENLTPEALLALGRLSDPQLSPDGSRILYGVSYTSLEQNRSCRNLFLCNADGTGRVQLTRYAKSVSNARWAADGKSIYFLQGGQLWKAPLTGSKLGKKVQLSDVPSGISEFKLSADQTRIIYSSTIPGPVTSPKDYNPALDKAQAFVTTDLMYRHWDHWVTETPRSYVASLSSKVTPETSTDLLGEEPYELPTEPFGGLEQLDWSPDGQFIAYSCRKKVGKEYAFSTNSGIYVYDVKSGKTIPVRTVGGYDTNPVWSPDGKSLAWISMERDGYEADRQRILVADFDGTAACNERELTTSFIYDAADICWTPDGKSLIFPAVINAVGALCSVDVATSEITRLTAPELWVSFGSVYGIEPSDEGCVLYTTVQSMAQPTELAKICYAGTPAASYEQISDENGHILAQLPEVKEEMIVLKSPDGGDLHCWVLYPPKFDPSAKNPGVEMFNGGPQTSLDQGWSYRWNFFLMAQQGYVVVLPCRHGDSGFGQEWKEQISGDYQGLNMEDYQIAGRWFKSQSWAGKLAGVGASYGGFSVYNMMGIHGDLYDCFISHAGIFDEKELWYTTEEMWFANWDNGALRPYAYEPGQTGPAGDGVTFGGMQQAGAPYAANPKAQHHYTNDPSSRVTKWHTPILCIHGMMDFRIPYTQGMAAFNAAQMMGVPSKLVMFPEECHWVLQPQNALFWHSTFFDWLDEWLR